MLFFDYIISEKNKLRVAQILRTNVYLCSRLVEVKDNLLSLSFNFL